MRTDETRDQQKPRWSRLAATGAAIGLLGLAAAPAMAHADTLVVGSPGGGVHPYDNTSCVAPAYTTPQAAVNDAADGDTILICAGTYTGSTQVAKENLKIIGAGTASTTLEGSSSGGVIGVW